MGDVREKGLGPELHGDAGGDDPWRDFGSGIFRATASASAAATSCSHLAVELESH